MPANQTRGTPGLLLVLFACALLLAAGDGWKLRRESRGQSATLGLTGLGDTRLYTSPSENDFLTPALFFSQAPQGLFRIGVHPVHRDDASMFRVETDQTGRHIVYTDAGPKPDLHGAATPRWYLKAGQDLYVEFGARKQETAFPAAARE